MGQSIITLFAIVKSQQFIEYYNKILNKQNTHSPWLVRFLSLGKIRMIQIRMAEVIANHKRISENRI